MEDFAFSTRGLGPGSQPYDDETGTIAHLPLPPRTRPYAMHLPEPDMARGCPEALNLLSRIAAACRAVRSVRGRSFDLRALPYEDKALMEETLGTGDVSARLEGADALVAQETMFAGVWQVADRASRRIEVGSVPEAIYRRAHEAVVSPDPETSERRAPASAVKAPAIAAELLDRSGSFRPGDAPHVVKLSRLPQKQGDLEYLDACFGRGAATLVSRGDGTHRVEATAMPHLWRVRHFDVAGLQIHDAFEISEVPASVRATPEDLQDSAERIDDVLLALS